MNEWDQNAETESGGEPPDAGANRRQLRAAAQAVLDQLSGDYIVRPGVESDKMFGSDGLKVNGKFFAFIGREGRLILKLPASQAADLVATGKAEPVTIGSRTTREWVGLPMPGTPGDPAEWKRALADAHRYVAAVTAPQPSSAAENE